MCKSDNPKIVQNVLYGGETNHQILISGVVSYKAVVVPFCFLALQHILISQTYFQTFAKSFSSKTRFLKPFFLGTGPEVTRGTRCAVGDQNLIRLTCSRARTSAAQSFSPVQNYDCDSWYQSQVGSQEKTLELCRPRNS